MRTDVYKHLLQNYGQLPSLWFGMVTEFTRTTLQRIVAVLLIANALSNVAANNYYAAKIQILWFVLAYALGAIVGVIGDLLAVHSADKEYEAQLLKYYGKLIGKDMAFYRENRTGELSGLFRQHLDGTMALVRLFRGDVIRSFVSLILPIVVLFAASWQLGLATSCIVVAQSAYILWASNRATKYRKISQQIYRKLNGEITDELTNIVAFKASGNTAGAYRKVEKLAQEEAKTFWLRHRVVALLELPRDLLASVGVGAGCIVVLVGIGGSIGSVELLVLTFILMLQVVRSASDLPDLVHRLDEQTTRVHSTLEYLRNTFETVRDPENPKQINSLGAIEVRNVDFSYYKARGYTTDAAHVFENLNITINAGEHVGIVGLSGVGKSTFAGLLMRFDDVNSGSIEIGGTDIRDVSLNALRQSIAYVPQEPQLFHRTIRENIAYHLDNVTEKQIVEAAKATHAHEFITKLKNSYDTIVGERGAMLSGGEKQRIVLAREILKNASIMILDEATSALDNESEQIIREALPSIIGPRTAIVIAHRLSTVAQLDRILFMHSGKIVESGTHQSLYKLEKLYRHLWDAQSTVVTG